MVDAGALAVLLKELGDGYAAQLPGKIAQIERQWQQAGQDEQEFQALLRAVHSLNGSGKTYGFSALSSAARSLEIALQQIAATGCVPTTAQRKQVEVMLGELRRAALQRDAAPGSPAGPASV